MEPEGGISTSWESVFTHQPGCWIITRDVIHKQNLSCMCLFGGFQRGEDRECRFSSHDLHLLPFWERQVQFVRALMFIGLQKAFCVGFGSDIIAISCLEELFSNLVRV
jgi:hypothetical protein